MARVGYRAAEKCYVGTTIDDSSLRNSKILALDIFPEHDPAVERPRGHRQWVSLIRLTHYQDVPPFVFRY